MFPAVITRDPVGRESLLDFNIFPAAPDHLFVQTSSWNSIGSKWGWGVQTTTLQAVAGPQTTVWLLCSVPRGAGVALSGERLVYSSYSFQPLAYFLTVRVVLVILLRSPAGEGNSSSQTRASLPFLLIPGMFLSNSQGRILKISSS